MKVAHRIFDLGPALGLTILVLALSAAQLATAQQQQPLSIGENTKLDANALASFGYSGGYGDLVPSNHALDFGFDGTVSGYYYNPNFISFTAHPYYDQSRADSTSQSLTGASGVTSSASFFQGSHFPGAVNYSYTDNSTGTFGLAGAPNFTTVGKSHGFGISWSALLPKWPTLSVGYSQGAGESTIYGTSQESNSNSRLFTLHSGYQIAGFSLTGFFNHNHVSGEFPEFISGEGAAQDESSSQDYGFGAQHRLPENGSFSISYDRASDNGNYTVTQEQANQGQNENTANVSKYANSNENAVAVFHPTAKLSWNVAESYIDNLTGNLAQSLSSSGAAPAGVNLGPGTYSLTTGAGLSYSFTNSLVGSAEATYYSQHYLGQSYSGEFMSGTVSYAKHLWNMFSFSAGVLDSSSDLNGNALGFTGNVNFDRRFGGWNTSASFSYGQNVQTLLATYTTSSYGYGASVSRRLLGSLRWGAAFGGGHSGLEQQAGNSTHSESYSTYLSMRRLTTTAYFNQFSGISLLGAGGLVAPTPLPGLTDLILYSGASYGGSISATPISRMSIAGSFSRSLSDTMAATTSRNNTEVFTAQLQYHLRRIGLMAGYTRFSQGISAIGAPATSTSFYVGFSRWFNFF
jgi:hypothetical protein